MTPATGQQLPLFALDKPCSKCGKVKSLDCFARAKKARDGHTSICKKCFLRLYYHDRPDKKERDKERYQRRKEETSARSKAYYQKHREQIIARVTRYAEAHREAAVQRKHRWYLAHREEMQERKKKRNQEDPDRQRAYRREWHVRNREKIIANVKAWTKANPEKVRMYHRVNRHHRRQWATENGGRFTRKDIVALYSAQHGCCAYRNVPLTIYNIEHKTPLSRGGTNWPDNLCLSCPSCNSRKHTKTDVEFRALLTKGAYST